MKVNQIDLAGQTIRLWRGTTKSGKPKLVKMIPGSDVLTLISACANGKKADDFVFTRTRGKKVSDFRGTWQLLCDAARQPDLLFHDLRRSAVRNMVRNCVPERVAMEISGHKTREIFVRYNIVSEAELEDAARKIEAGKNRHKPYIMTTFPQVEPKRALPV